jgi:threonyl-tRNA synthetase
MSILIQTNQTGPDNTSNKKQKQQQQIVIAGSFSRAPNRTCISIASVRPSVGRMLVSLRAGCCVRWPLSTLSGVCGGVLNKQFCSTRKAPVWQNIRSLSTIPDGGTATISNNASNSKKKKQNGLPDRTVRQQRRIELWDNEVKRQQQHVSIDRNVGSADSSIEIQVEGHYSGSLHISTNTCPAEIWQQLQHLKEADDDDTLSESDRKRQPKPPPTPLVASVAMIEPDSLATVTADQTWDMSRPLVLQGGNKYRVTFHDFASAVGREAMWHSSAHLLGSALETVLGDRVMLSDGPALDTQSWDASEGRVPPNVGGFFYDFADNRTLKSTTGSAVEMDTSPAEVVADLRVSPADFKDLESAMSRLVSSKVPFERLQVNREFALEMFQDNVLKQILLDKLHADAEITLYRCGNFVDLCRGPHVPHAGVLGKGALHLISCSESKHQITLPPSSSVESPEQQQQQDHSTQMQRVYGISFGDKAQLKDWKARTVDARQFDHRVVGKQQGLFMFHPVSPGSAFFLPHGQVIFQRLLTMLRQQYVIRGYSEVSTPLLYSHDLWKQSGHLDHYADDMFGVSGGVKTGNDSILSTAAGAGAADAENEQPQGSTSCAHHAAPSPDQFGLKPMNCPGHCVVFASSSRSYRDLPIRMADFSPLHRNEVTGALGGLTRLRRFHQDDAHIFCTLQQVSAEIADCLDFINHVYSHLFGFSYSLRLSTRPEESMGSQEQWDVAEDSLRQALTTTGQEWTLDAGEGAFYGPKIDISVTDAMGRQHQCATIQLDFQLPDRFELEYNAGGSSGGEGADETEAEKETKTLLKRPVMVHRAVLGSVERFIAIMLEHTRGKLPFWLSPRQVAIVPISQTQGSAYAQRVLQALTTSRPTVDCTSSHDMPPSVAAAATRRTSSSNVLDANGLCVQIMDPELNGLRKRIRQAHTVSFPLFLSLFVVL